MALAHDINPNPHKDVHAITLDGRTKEADIAAALACAELYRFTDARAQAMFGEVEQALRDRRQEADAQGLGRAVGADRGNPAPNRFHGPVAQVHARGRQYAPRC
jgi:hypothetical protein